MDRESTARGPKNLPDVASATHVPPNFCQNTGFTPYHSTPSLKCWNVLLEWILSLQHTGPKILQSNYKGHFGNTTINKSPIWFLHQPLLPPAHRSHSQLLFSGTLSVFSSCWVYIMFACQQIGEWSPPWQIHFINALKAHTVMWKKKEDLFVVVLFRTLAICSLQLRCQGNGISQVDVLM